MLRIGLDIDGVLYHFQKTALFLVNYHFGYQYSLADWKEWGWLEDALTPAQFKWLWNEGIELGLFRYGHVWKGAIEGVRQLAKVGEIAIISHRPASAVQDTLDWLAFYRLPIREVYLLTQEQKKSTVPSCHYYIDDGAHNAIDLATCGTVLLMDRPWNQEPVENSRTIIRVYNWAGVVTWIVRLEDA